MCCRIEFPLFLPILALASLLTTASLFNNHTKLLDSMLIPLFSITSA